MSFPALSAESTSRSIALGNPSVAPQSTPHMNMNSNVWPHGSSTDPGCQGSTLFLVNADPTIYDSGFRVLVSYYPNPTIPDCEENELINIEVDSSMSMYIFKTEILPQLSLDSFITRIVMATQTDGSVSVAPDTSPTSHCLGTPFPPGFTHDGIPISDLRRLPEHDIDNVVVRKDITDSPLYVFKHDMDIATLTTHFDHQSNTLLQEALFLTRLDSPFILRPSALITDANEHFRGYLLPYQPAGSLANVLSKIGPRTVSALEPISASRSYPPDSIPLPVANLEWEIKHAWAVDIASGIDYLHKQNTCWGDVKLDNIVLSPDGRCRLIDCAPIMGMSNLYAAPEMEDLFHNPLGRLTPARDVFALGLVLWALAEETGRFKRAVGFVAPRLSWTMGDDFAPTWYQDLVNQCVAAEPTCVGQISIRCEATECHLLLDPASDFEINSLLPQTMTFPELTVEAKAHAIALGNPPVSPQKMSHACVDEKIKSHGCSIDPGYRASTLFLVDSNSTLYDSGFYVLVTYYLNSVIPDCEENMLINLEDSPMRVEFFETKILPQLSIDTFITKVIIATQTDGTVAVSPDRSATLDCLGFPFPPGFTHKELPAVPISHLRRSPGMCLRDIVARQDVLDPLLYVFKKEMDITILTTHVDHQSDILLQEALFLMRLDSPWILRPSSLVIDAKGRFRGYPLPFQPAGSLASVLSEVRERDAPVLQPYYAHPSEEEPVKRLYLHGRLDWGIKNAWAVDIATGIAYLHKQNNFWGDVKLDNIVLSPDGRCRLIDCAPMMGMSDLYAAPELEDFFHNPFGRLTPAWDIFALGLVLWALAEETGRFKRVVEFVSPRLSWTMGDDFAPTWYQDMVNQCVAAEPKERPTITQVLNILSRCGSL